MAKYDLDADEHSGNHPGVDLKLALGTPIGAVGGGRVYAVSSDARLGLHVIVEHRNESGQFFSVYAHLGSSKVSVGDTVKPGQTLGFVGLTGMTTMAHLHLEVHRGAGPAQDGLHAAAFAGSEVINPMVFIGRNGKM
jgi:murein DD-endopeptidase MepM/ murein hydrolase activator NlpD